MDEQNLDKTIMEKIRAGEVVMRSRPYLIFKNVLWVMGLCILAAVGVLIFSFVLFALRSSGLWVLPYFGWRGWREFLIYFPWVLAAAVLVFVLAVEWFVKKYTFAYRRPLLYSSLFVAVLLIVGGYLVFATPLHQQLSIYVSKNHLPVMENVYGSLPPVVPDDVYVGRVLSVRPGQLDFFTNQGKGYTVIISPNTRLPFGGQVLPQDHILVIGDADDATITAYGIKKIDPIPHFPFPFFPR